MSHGIVAASLRRTVFCEAPGADQRKVGRFSFTQDTVGGRAPPRRAPAIIARVVPVRRRGLILWPSDCETLQRTVRPAL